MADNATKTESKTKSTSKQSLDIDKIVNAAVTAALAAQAQVTASTPEPKPLVVEVSKGDGVVYQNAQKELDTKQRMRQEFTQKIVEEQDQYVWYTIPGIYKRWVGDLPVLWNGALIKVNADGNPVRIHKGFIPIIEAKLRYYDDKIKTMRTDRGDTREMPQSALRS